MSASTASRPAHAVPAGVSRMERMLKGYSGSNFSIDFPDGMTWTHRPQSPVAFILRINRGAAWSAMLSGDELRLAEAFQAEYLDIRGDIAAAFELGDFLLSQPRNLVVRAAMKCIALGNSLRGYRGGFRARGGKHSLGRDRAAIAHHYDISNDFYERLLDSRMLYSCAYFKHRSESLDSAQENKLDHICRKLRLKPGESLLDVGCGWGGLVIHACRHYGVRALGITLSRAQAELANQWIQDAGLSSVCEVLRGDYRRLCSGPFDKISSVGMMEHVGESGLREYFSRLWNLLLPGGTLLNHGIAAGDQGEGKFELGPFMARYVFPDGELLPVWRTMQTAGACGFEVRDLESLREHYVLTLEHWLSRLESNPEEMQRIAGRHIFRTWKLYMAGSAYRFRKGEMNLYQMLAYKPGGAPLPLTREDWYR